MTVVIHHNDLDGRCGAAIIGSYTNGAKYFDVSYETPMPLSEICNNETVFLVDFTPPKARGEFSKIISKAKEVIWIDHHQKNINDYPEYKDLKGVRTDTNPSGAMLAWHYCYPNLMVPTAVKYISDFDTWTHKYPESRLFYNGLLTENNMPFSDIWKGLLNINEDGIEVIFGEHNYEERIQRIIDKGQIITDYNKIMDAESLAQYGYEATFEGYRAIAYNTPKKGSDIFGDNSRKYDIMIVYEHNGKRYNVSIYSANDVDCSYLAGKYGGGGHPGAAGFSCDTLPFKRS